MISADASTQVDTAVSRLSAWLDTMRGLSGYGGPVVHWWQQSLMYTGPGLDWRYEGIIIGYLQLWQRTEDPVWLVKARQAGDDLLSGQREDRHFAASAFECNPATAGTPHEAACDIGLLRLALALREVGAVDWEKYAQCAERNLHSFYLEQLWDGHVQSFRDDRRVPSFVPNKAATACEAFFLLAEVTGDSHWVDHYAIPNLERILEHQVRGGRLDGAIAQNSFGEHKIEKYFPIYIARCIPALLRGSVWTNKEHYAASALRAMQFIVRWGYDDGSFPTVIYDNHRVNRYPSWIAPLSDILRVAGDLRPYGLDANLNATEHRLFAGQDASGGIQTATGFATLVGGKSSVVPELRDVLHVAGWCDKAFRYLTSRVGCRLSVGESLRFEAECTFQGKSLQLVETPEILEINGQQDAGYRWHKGEPWPQIASPEFWLH